MFAFCEKVKNVVGCMSGGKLLRVEKCVSVDRIGKWVIWGLRTITCIRYVISVFSYLLQVEFFTTEVWVNLSDGLIFLVS